MVDAAALARSLPGGILPEPLRDGARVVVTGCAGFIGSHLAEALLASGCSVTGVDSLTDYYDSALKRENLSYLTGHSGFRLIERDILDLDPVELLAGQRICFHLAAQAGVRASWGSCFDEYVDRNIRATQRLLEACIDPAVAPGLGRFVYSSSSSVYGDSDELPLSEAALPRPHSPYGVTKLAAEHLCGLYSANFGVPVSGLRYFTVYGPRQRPDMAFRKFIEAALDGRPWQIFGDGEQTRDFTYVHDAVRANILAAGATVPYIVVNVGGGARVRLNDALDLMRDLLREAAPGVEPVMERLPLEKGDVRDTWADPELAAAGIGFRPTVPFAEGLARQVEWVVNRRTRLD